MAIVNLVSNLRAYNPKFSDFSVNQVVDQPIPAEPNRTAPSNLDRRQDDFKRLTSFLLSGKGLTFAAKQEVLDQAAWRLGDFRGTTLKERAVEVANTAARLTNIALQAGPPGEIARFSSHPFVRYIEARELVQQIGNLRRPDAPSLANRGRTIIQDNEWVNNAIQASTVSKNIDGDSTSVSSSFALEGSKFYSGSGVYVVDTSIAAGDIVKAGHNIFTDQSAEDDVTQSNIAANRIDVYSDSLKSTLDLEDSSRFDKPVRKGDKGYVVEAAGSRRGFTGPLISDRSVNNNVDDDVNRFISTNGSKATETKLNPRVNELTGTDGFNATRTIRVNARNAGRDADGNFRAKVPYIDNLGDLSDSKNENNNIKLKFDPYTAKYPRLIKPIEFTATLDDFSDNYTSNWNSTQYIGRGEPVYNFNSTSRTINFSFKAYSTSASKLRDLYKRLNQLASYTNPTYTRTFMAGTFIKLTLGDYLVATPGFLTGVDFKWQTSYPWEVFGSAKSIIDSRISEISDIPLLPHILDVGIGFTPIHNFIPEANPDTVNRAFIATDDKVMSYADKVRSLAPPPLQIDQPTEPTDVVLLESSLDLQPLGPPQPERAFGPVDEFDVAGV